MGDKMLVKGESILLVHRRLFGDDEPRCFVGVVEGYDDGMARVSGYTWRRDPHPGGWSRKPDRRTKLVSLISGTLLAYPLPEGVEIDSLEFVSGGDGRLELRDGQGFTMDLSERPAY